MASSESHGSAFTSFTVRTAAWLGAQRLLVVDIFLFVAPENSLRKHRNRRELAGPTNLRGQLRKFSGLCTPDKCEEMIFRFKNEMLILLWRDHIAPVMRADVV
jgi:hypothetical protein